MSNGPSENPEGGSFQGSLGDTPLMRNSFGAKSQDLVSDLLPRVLDDLKTRVNAGKALAPHMLKTGSSGEDPALYDFVLAANQPDPSPTAASRQRISLSAQNGGSSRFEVEQEFVGAQVQSLLLIV